MNQSTSTNTSAVSILCDGTIRAAILILRDKGIDTSCIDAEKLSADLKAELKNRITEIMGEWKDALDTHMSEDFLRYQMNVQANHVATMALKAGGWI